MEEIRARLPANTAIEIWWQDEARVGQKTMLTRRWAQRGSRPTALRDQRTKSAYIFGAICPARGVGAGLVLPRCNTQAMQWHLDEISALVTPGAHAVLIIDRAGWHTTGKLDIPSNITLYQRQELLTHMRPISHSDGHDRFGLVDKFVPGVATGLDDGVVIFEDAVGEPILAEVLPDVLDRVELG